MKEKIKFGGKTKDIMINSFLQIITTIICIVLFSFIMYFLEIDNKYSPVIASLSVGIGAFINAFLLSKKRKSKGYLLGFYIGVTTFAIVTIIGLILNKGNVTINTLFHFVIFILSSITGGILGVNKSREKYI